MSTRESGGRVILAVEDSGEGIPEQQYEAVFERFVTDEVEEVEDEV